MKETLKKILNKLPTDLLGVNLRKLTTWLVLAFIIGLGFMLTQEAKAETTIELAPVLVVGGDRYNGGFILIEERWAGKYVLGLGLTTAWECRDQDNCKRGNGETNQFLLAQRVIRYKKFEMGIGISYWHNTTPAWNSHTPFALSIAWHFNDRLSIRERHFSTGGSSTNNGGLDMLTVGWTF